MDNFNLAWCTISHVRPQLISDNSARSGYEAQLLSEVSTRTKQAESITITVELVCTK